MEELDRKKALEILIDNMSIITAKHINEISFLEDWIVDAMIEYHKAKVKNLDLFDVSDKCTRVEVIDNTGRAYTKYGCKDVQIQMQDQERTLKVFIS